MALYINFWQLFKLEKISKFPDLLIFRLDKSQL